MMQSVRQLLDQLAQEGGAIVVASDCDPDEFTRTKLDGRVGEDAEGLLYVRRTAEWLRTAGGITEG